MELRYSDKSLLYVEDEKPTRRIFARLLRKFFKVVYEAENGQEGLRLFKEHTPDAVITDLVMPVMTGDEMIKLIRAESSSTPILVTTAFSERINDLPDVEAIISKPIMHDDIIKILDRLFENGE